MSRVLSPIAVKVILKIFYNGYNKLLWELITMTSNVDVQFLNFYVMHAHAQDFAKVVQLYEVHSQSSLDILIPKVFIDTFDYLQNKLCLQYNVIT